MPVHNGEVEGAVPELLDGRHVIGNGIIDRLVGLVIRMIERNVTIGDVADVAPLELVLDNLEPAWLVLRCLSEIRGVARTRPCSGRFPIQSLPSVG
jgi:hypothetical protein